MVSDCILISAHRATLTAVTCGGRAHRLPLPAHRRRRRSGQQALPVPVNLHCVLPPAPLCCADPIWENSSPGNALSIHFSPPPRREGESKHNQKQRTTTTTTNTEDKRRRRNNNNNKEEENNNNKSTVSTSSLSANCKVQRASQGPAFLSELQPCKQLLCFHGHCDSSLSRNKCATFPAQHATTRKLMCA